MKKQTLWRACLRTLVLLAVLLLFLMIDWLPTLKDINRLQRNQSDYLRKIKDFNALIQVFEFPDEDEKQVFSQNEVFIRRSLPLVEDDASWLAMVLPFLRKQARQDGIDSAVFLTAKAPGASPCASFKITTTALSKEFQQWLMARSQELDQHCQAALDKREFPWRVVFNHADFFGPTRLASRPLAIVLTAKLAALLKFVNHCTWFDGRLEIVRLRLGPGKTSPLVLIFCRGNYLVSGSSAWLVPAAAGGNVENLLIDADSELLWQPVASEAAGLTPEKELAPVRDSGMFLRKRSD